jgi:hypothetical protein
MASDDLWAFGIGFFDQLTQLRLCFLHLPDSHLALPTTSTIIIVVMIENV